MHIGFFTDGYLPQLNGVATSIDLLAQTLERFGQQVSIFAPAMDGYVDKHPGVHRLSSVKAFKDPPLWLSSPVSTRVWRETRHMDLDIVHSHSPFALHVLAYQVAQRQHIPLVYTYHTLLSAHVHTVKLFKRTIVPPRLAEKFSVWTCDMCDRVVAPSEKIKDLLERYGTHCPVTVVHNGIAMDRFQNVEPGFLHARLGLPAQARILLAVGRLTQEKNVGFLVNVLARVHEYNPDVYLIPVGQGPLRDEFQAQAARMGIGKNLVFTGPIPMEEMPRVYADADIYVSASFSEAHSMAALEALASGVPMVVVRDQSLAMMVVEGQNGFVVDLDEQVFAQRVLDILEHPEAQQTMRACSREISNRFSIENQAHELIGVYSEVIAARNRKR
ncbi:MAG: glycosyltransferase [Anaerolineae bacterium]